MTVARDRSFLLDAKTIGARVTFVGQANVWNLEGATICTPKEIPDLRSTPKEAQAGKAAGLCPKALFDVKGPNDITVYWLEGAETSFSVDSDGSLSVEVDRTGKPGSEVASFAGWDSGRVGLPDGSFIVVPADVWSRHGALVFSGQSLIGSPMAPGARNYLLSGRWEARQSDLANSVRDVVEVVKQGDLSLGVSVTVMNGSMPATLYGSITPMQDAGDGQDGLHLVALSQRGKTELHLYHFGSGEPSIIRPDWIDRISSSALLVAVAAIMTFAATGFQILLHASKAEASPPPAPAYRKAAPNPKRSKASGPAETAASPAPTGIIDVTDPAGRKKGR
jgi:hypothetical protein